MKAAFMNLEENLVNKIDQKSDALIHEIQRLNSKDDLAAKCVQRLEDDCKELKKYGRIEG